MHNMTGKKNESSASISSEYLMGLFKKDKERDEVVPIKEQGAEGFQVVRIYKNKELSEKYRMFINIYVRTEEPNRLLASVDMVTESSHGNPQNKWKVVSRDEMPKGFKCSNFHTSYEDEIFFNRTEGNVEFKKESMSIAAFLCNLELNHLRRNMFLFSETVSFFKHRVNAFKFSRTHFWLTGREYQKLADIFQTLGSITTEQKKENLSKQDPLWGYFRMLPSVLLGALIVLAPFTYYASKNLSSEYFNVANPFFIFYALLIFAVVHEISEWLDKPFRELESVSGDDLSRVREKLYMAYIKNVTTTSHGRLKIYGRKCKSF